MRFSSIYALAASLSTVAAASQGFNYGATKSDGTFNFQADFESLFSSAKGLAGTNGGFTSARLYTMIQGGSYTNESTQAIPAAIKTETTLLLGLWASAGPGPFSAEIIALKSAISQYGEDLAKLVVGISVGNEDLYRNSPTGIAADAGVGADAATIAGYIAQVKSVIAGTVLSSVPVGHVDTWTAWAQSNDPNLNEVISACDFIGMDAYPYFQSTMPNSIGDAKSLFNSALAATKGAVGGKAVWITETGWPVSGKTENQAVPNIANAKTYWDEVGCPNFGSVNTWWFTLQDSNPITPNPSFGVIGSSYSTSPLYDLSCSDVSTASSVAGSSASPSSSTSPVVSGGSGSTPESSAASGSAPSSSANAALSGSGSAASSGSGLTPSEGAGNGIIGASANVTGSSGSNTTVPAGTATSGLSAATKSSPTGPGTPGTVSTNAANILSCSFSAIGAVLAVMAAL